MSTGRGTNVTTAQGVAAGAFTPAYGGRIDKMPAFCRVAGDQALPRLLHPLRSVDAGVRVDGKFLGLGNGGFTGYIGLSAL